MGKYNFGRALRALSSPFFSPKGFFLRAILVVILFVACHAAGLREYTSLISLTNPEGTSPRLSVFFCLLYLVAYFSFILIAPILVLSSVIFAILQRLVRGRAG